MRAGTLRNRVTIQEPVEGSADALGQKPVTWSDVVEVWAAVLPQSGREFYRAQQIRAELTHLLSIRYRSGINATLRIKLGTRYLYVVAVENVEERNHELLLLCVEDVS